VSEKLRSSASSAPSPAPAAAPAAGPVIFFTAGGVRFAVEAAHVEEIRQHEERAASTRLRARGPQPIDFAFEVGLGPGQIERFVVLKPGERALGVTDVERMSIQPKLVALPPVFCGAERQWYRGLLLLDNDVIPLVRTEYWRQALPSRGAGGAL
jgi:hypothetical protein